MWNDQLTSYNGKSITYDAIGNPLTYGNYTYQWTQGRRLFCITDGATGAISHFDYNDEGIRTSKVAGGLYHEYVVTGGRINRELVHSSSNADSSVLKEIRYYYDVSGKPIAIRAFTRTSSTASFTDTTYYLLTNLQGDVVGIYNASGTKIYEYAYDAWGNIIKSSQVATGGTAAHAVNPFRYRGYYFDTETNLYYLQSRYYNPEWGRFLNADVYVNANGDLLGYNMFAYCSNNPVMGVDFTGRQTTAFALSLNFTFFGQGIQLNFGVASSSDDWAFQFSYAASDDSKTEIKQKGVSMGASVVIQHTKCDSVRDLAGSSTSTGIGGPVSLELVSNDTGVIGGQVGAGIGHSLDLHQIESYTYNSKVWKHWNPAKKIAKWFMER